MFKEEGCSCEICKFGAKVSALRDYLVDQGEEEHLKTLDDLYSMYVHEGIDFGHLQAIVDKQWPNYAEHMKAKGWVEDVWK